MRAPRAVWVSALPCLRAAGYRQRCNVPAVDGAVAGGPCPGRVHVAAVGVTRGRSVAAGRARAMGILVCAPVAAARPAALAGATGRCAIARLRGRDAGGWPESGAV